MFQHLLTIIILVLTSYPQTATQSSQFKDGQSVYLVALKGNCSPDFLSERELRAEFEKQNVFKIAKSLQAADFVFLIYLDYGVGVTGGWVQDYVKSINAYAVSPASYTQYKSDLYSLRDEALWKTASDQPAKINTVVKRFHDYTAVKK